MIGVGLVEFVDKEEDMREEVIKGNWKRLLCKFFGHDKDVSFAYPNTHWC